MHTPEGTALCPKPGPLSTASPGSCPFLIPFPTLQGCLMPWDMGPTYKGDHGSQQQDAHQKVLELLQHQLPQGLPWERECCMRPGPKTD